MSRPLAEESQHRTREKKIKKQLWRVYFSLTSRCQELMYTRSAVCLLISFCPLNALHKMSLTVPPTSHLSSLFPLAKPLSEVCLQERPVTFHYLVFSHTLKPLSLFLSLLVTPPYKVWGWDGVLHSLLGWNASWDLHIKTYILGLSFHLFYHKTSRRRKSPWILIPLSLSNRWSPFFLVKNFLSFHFENLQAYKKSRKQYKVVLAMISEH